MTTMRTRRRVVGSALGLVALGGCFESSNDTHEETTYLRVENTDSTEIAVTVGLEEDEGGQTTEETLTFDSREERRLDGWREAGVQYKLFVDIRDGPSEKRDLPPWTGLDVRMTRENIEFSGAVL